MDYLINSCVSRIGQQLFGLIYTAVPSAVVKKKKKKKKKREGERIKQTHFFTIV